MSIEKNFFLFRSSIIFFLRPNGIDSKYSSFVTERIPWTPSVRLLTSFLNGSLKIYRLLPFFLGYGVDFPTSSVFVAREESKDEKRECLFLL